MGLETQIVAKNDNCWIITLIVPNDVSSLALVYEGLREILSNVLLSAKKFGNLNAFGSLIIILYFDIKVGSLLMNLIIFEFDNLHLEKATVFTTEGFAF